MAKTKSKINISDIIGKGYGTFWRFKGRYRVVKGSRGSKKSYTAALWYIYNMMKLPESNLVVVRKVDGTNRDSTFAQLKTAIMRLGVDHLWKCTVSPLEITYMPTGQKILFRGLDDPLKLTSITVEKGYLCWAWFEEVYQIMNKKDFDKVDLSIRGLLPPHLFKQITLTLNPWSDKHWINGAFFIGKNKDRKSLIGKGLDIHSKTDTELVMTTNYRINEYLDDEDRRVYEEMLKNNPKRAEIEANGEWGVAEGLVYENWEELNFDYREISKRKDIDSSFGLDFGYTNDPSALICLLVSKDKGEIYIFDEHYQKSMVNKEVADMIKYKGYSKEVIIADSSEPKSIEEIKREGIYKIKAAAKGKDSILNGIQFIQGFKIFVHPKCVNTITELSVYSWDENKDGNKINKPIDDYNHLLDAFRYGMEKFKKDNKLRTMNRSKLGL